jgi:hypothetical protein
LTRELCKHHVPFLSHSFNKNIVEDFRDVTFVPDFHFMDSTAFLDITTNISKTAPTFESRHSRVFWRGVTTGWGPNCSSLQRVRMVKLTALIPWVDAKLINLCQVCKTEAELPEDNMMSVRRPIADWVMNRGLFDVDGNVNAWGLRWRLQSGSVIFRIEGPHINQYILALRPWKHYVPIAADLSDLEDKTSLITSDSAATVQLLKEIARAASVYSKKFTLESEIERVARALSIILDQGYSGQCGIR